jgi:hypothetical protein
MYDNLDFSLSRDKVNNIDFLREVPKLLERTSEHYFNDNQDVCVTGYLGTLKVSVSNRAVKVKDSSFCKWLLGDNLQGLYRGDVERGFDKLSDLLSLPMQDANVTRIDLAQNIIVKHDMGVYLNHLGNLQYYNRLTQNNGLYYQNGNGLLLFYGKVHESNIKGVPVPEIYKGRNVLRYERRFKKDLCKQFNMPELTVKSLYLEDFYVGIMDRWYNDYVRIQKLTDIHFDYTMVTGKKEVYQQSVLYYVQQRGGLLNVLNEVKEAQKKKELTPKQALDLRLVYSEACNSELLTSKSELIQELDSKMKESLRFYR